MTIRIVSFTKSIFENFTYTCNSGLARGLKRKGGLGFIPRPLNEEEKFLNNYNYKDKIIFDIGAHHGIYTLFFANAAGNDGKIFSFEPNPQNYSRIIENVRLNGFTNITVFKIAIGKDTEKSHLIFRNHDTGTGTLDKEIQKQIIDENNFTNLETDVDSIDNLRKTKISEVPALIKIDVEGFELKVLEGMRNTLKTDNPELFIEIHGADLSEKICNITNIFYFLKIFNYEIYHIESKQKISENNLMSAATGHIYCRVLPLF